MPSTGWPSMHDCFNWLEDSSNYSAGVLLTNVAKNINFITGRGIESQIPYVSRQSCLLHYGDRYIPCFLFVPPCIGLRWCSSAVKSFLYIYPYIFPLSSIQSKINGSTNGETICQCYLPLRHYCMMLLSFGTPSSDYLAKQLTHLLIKPTE